MRRRITESLDLDSATHRWSCHDCGQDLGPATEDYKRATLVRERDPHDLWQPSVAEPFTFSYNPDWMRLVEFYCPRCALLMDVEVLPPGHPLTHDIELDLSRLADSDTGGAEDAVAMSAGIVDAPGVQG
jgi:acetone carboxylase gamma subunit